MKKYYSRILHFRGAILHDRRLLLAVGVLALYFSVYFLLAHFLGPGVTAISLLPAGFIAWLYGVRGGLLAATIVFFLTFLNPFLFEDDSLVFMTRIGAVAGTLALFSSALVIGYLRDLKEYLKRELAERREIEAALRRSEARYRLLFENVGHAFALHEFILDVDGRASDYRFIDVNDAFGKIVGLSREEIIGKKGSEVISVLDPYWLEQYARVAFTGRTTRFERFSRSFNRYYEVVAFSPSHGQFAALFLDITDRKRNEMELRFASHHDGLTSLYNRTYFDATLARLENEGVFPVSVLVADVNSLKYLNDSQGHAAGDDLLRSAAMLLQASFRVADVISRIGGDEFAVIMPYTDAAGAQTAERRLRQRIREHNQNQEGPELFLSIGTATAMNGLTFHEVVKVADQAMYLEKQTYKNRRMV